MTMQFLRFFYAILFVLFTLPGFSSQSPETDETLPLPEIIFALEERHNTTIFYQQDWLSGETFNQSILERPLPEALSLIAGKTGLTYMEVEEMIFLMPRDRRRTGPAVQEDGLTIIGDPAIYGRYSRATISGKILDAATYEPLLGAVVYDANTETGASTDFDGRFEMTLPVGEHNLRISYVGYDDLYRKVRLISDGEITFEIFSGATQLDEVIVTARRARDHVTSTQMSIISMDAQTLQELPGSFGEQDIVRSFTLMPGVQTIGEFGSGFNVRGGSADQNLLLVENVPLFNSSHLFGLISVINPDMVSSVTLMKAGIPARYGERASAIMDIRLGNGLDIERTSLEGGIGLINSRLHLEAPIVQDKAAISIGVRSSYSDWLLQNIPNEDLMNSSVGFNDLSGLLNVALGQNHRLTLFGYRSFDRSNFGDDVDYEYFNHLASLRLNSYISQRLSSVFIAGYSGYQYSLAEIPEYNPEGHYQINSDIKYRKLTWYLSYYPGERLNMDFGLNAIRYDIEPGHLRPLGDETNITPRSMDNEQAYELSGFVSGEMILSDRIALELGLRYTHYLQVGPAIVREYAPGQAYSHQSILDTIQYQKGDIVTRYDGLEPRFGLRYSLGENSSMKLSYNRANQYINLISNTSVMAPTDLWKLSDTYIRPLQSDQVALGYFRNFLDNTLETSLEVYYKKLHNAIEYRSGAQIAMNDYLEMDIINARGYNYGAELYIRKNSGDLTGFASYTYSSSQRRTNSLYPERQINQNRYFPSNYDRPHNLTLNANYYLSRRWRIGATFTYNTGRPVTLPEYTFMHGNDLLLVYSDRNHYRLPAYHRLDISISLGENLRIDQRGKGSFTFSVINVYGKKNPFSVFYKKEPSTLQGPRSFDLYQLYIIGRPLPTITYNFSF